MVKPHPDDIVVWPNGDWATVDDVERGGYRCNSDDYEIATIENVARLTELGLAVELDLT